jgi:hypothetical protein
LAAGNARSTKCSENKDRELIAVKVLHTLLLSITVGAFKVRPFGSYALMPAPSPPFRTILEVVLWNDLLSWHLPDVISVIKMPSFQYFLFFGKRKKRHWGLDPVSREGVSAQLFVN